MLARLWHFNGCCGTRVAASKDAIDRHWVRTLLYTASQTRVGNMPLHMASCQSPIRVKRSKHTVCLPLPQDQVWQSGQLIMG